MGTEERTMRSLGLIGLLILLVRIALAQGAVSPEVGPPTPSRLQSMEAIYQKNLKAAQAPLLKEYLADLNAMLLRAPASDAPAITAEIARVNKMIASGVIEFSAAKPAAPPTNVGRPLPSSGVVFSLDPNEAVPPQPADGFVPIGSASWTLSLLPAGTYEIIAQYNCTTLPTGSAKVKLDYHGNSFTRELKANHLTTKDGSFRVMRLGQITLTEDVKLEKVTLSSVEPGEPWFFVKHILIAKPKAPK